MAKTNKINPTQQRLNDIDKELSELSSERDKLKAHWLLEKELISEIRIKKENLENLKLEADNFERLGDLGNVAEIRYGKLIDLQKQNGRGHRVSGRKNCKTDIKARCGP